MILNWFVAVAEHRRDEVAECALNAKGFETFLPRTWQREKTVAGPRKTTYDLCLSPYLFFQSDGSDDEYSEVKRQRGVLCVLTGSDGHPSPIPAAVIDAHRDREMAERAGLVPRPKTKSRADLVLNAKYTIIRHKLFQGRTGVLVATSAGIAYLDCDRVRLAVPDCDIKFIPVPVQAKKGAA